MRDRSFALFLIGVSATAPAALAQEENALKWTLDSRLRWEGADGAPFGPGGPPPQTVLLERVLLGVEVKPDHALSLYAQIGWHNAVDREGGPVSTDVNRWDIQQAYATWRVAPDFSVRIGRQELPLGSARLVGTRDSPNVRRSFDGIAASLSRGSWNLRALAVAPVEIEPGAFDDAPSSRERLYGLYATRTLPHNSGVTLDAYFLVLDRPATAFQGVRGDETRITIGMRFAGASGALDWDVEPIAQIGSFADQEIRAWTLASAFGWRTSFGGLPVRIGLKANVTSGDKDPEDGRLGTFNPLYPRLNYFNEGPAISPQNHIDLHPNFEVALADNLRVFASFDAFWRTRSNDAFYRGPGVAVPGTALAPERFAGALADLEANWKPTANLEIRAYASYWSPGPALEFVGAEATRFAMVSLSYRH